ncbi:MAG: patatin-like phospholipase family protein [Bacteroidales bacterium]|nr:patatin-like phospholipase family protein [Bacteroidales bacterium]
MSVICAQAQSDKAKSSSRPKVGVVLGGGGAKGASHIGVLKYLEEMGIPVDYVAGTSMGSIIGGLYALGYSPDELTKLIASMNWSEYIGNKIDRSSMSLETRKRSSTTQLSIPFSLESLFDKDPNTSLINNLPSAYVNNSSLVNLFNDLCIGYQEEMDFNDLPIPFACIATDIATGEEVVMRSGSMPTAMRASMAIPGVFSPVTIGDKVLVDGGLVNNFPADVLKEMGATIIIGVEVTNEKKITQKDIQSLPQLLGRLVVNSTQGKRKANRELCNVHIIPDVSGFGMLSFTPEAIDTLVGRGFKKAAEYHDQLLEIKREIDEAAGHPVTKELHAPKARNLTDESVTISSIEFNNVPERDSRWLMRKGRLKAGNKYNKDEIDHAVNLFRGTGCYDEITYTLKEQDSTNSNGLLDEFYDLSFQMKPAKPHVVGLGFRYDTEEGAALLLKVGLNEKKFEGSKLDLKVKLSYNPRISLTYTYSKPALANFSVAYDYRNEYFGVLISKKSLNLHYQQQKVSGYVSQFHLLNFSTNVGLSFTGTKYDLASLEEDSETDSILLRDTRMLTPFVSLTYDNLDDTYFAKHGVSANITSHFYYETKEKGKYFDLSYSVLGYITPKNGRFTIIPQLYGRFSYVPNLENMPLGMANLFGSEIPGRHFEEQMPFIGIGSIDATDNSIMSILRCDLRYNFYGKHYLTAMYNIMANWSYWIGHSFSEVFAYSSQGAGLKYSYNTKVGPVSLTGHWLRFWGGDGFLNHFGAYFSFGYTF